MSLKILFENLQSISSSKIYFKVKYNFYDIIHKYPQHRKRNLQYLLHYFYWHKKQEWDTQISKRNLEKNIKIIYFLYLSRQDKGYMNTHPPNPILHVNNLCSQKYSK